MCSCICDCCYRCYFQSKRLKAYLCGLVADVYKRQALDGLGDVTVEAWAVSEAGCQSDTASEDAKVDIDGPDVYKRQVYQSWRQDDRSEYRGEIF